MKSSKIFLALSLWIAPFLSLPHLPSLSSGSSISFYCIRNPVTKVYATQIALVSGEKYDIIYWEKRKNPETICSDVSRKFQTFSDQGKFNYIKPGKDKNGLDMICILADKNDECDEQNKVFHLLRGTKPEEAVNGLKGAIRRKNSPIYQSSDDEIISLKDLIEQLRLEKSQGSNSKL